MKRWLIASVLLMTSVAAGQLTNGGFEELGRDRFPACWVRFMPDPDAGVIRATTDAVEGRFAIYMEARKTAPVGVNREYKAGKPGEVVPEIGAMLPFKKGALVFRYKLLKATTDNVRVYAIPMKADNLEGGASRATYILPPQFSGDKRWHTGVLAFDFSDKPEIRSVQVGLRINEGGKPAPAAVIFDDFRFVDKAGWHLRLVAIQFEEGAKAGEEGYLTLKLENTGDEPASLTTELKTPAKFQAELSQQPETITPNATGSISWSVKGLRRIGTKFVVKWQADPQTMEEAIHVCSARLHLRSFGFVNAVLFTGSTHPLRLTLFNEGDAVITKLSVSLSLGKGLALVSGQVKQALPLLPPGANLIEWQVRAKQPDIVSATVQVEVGRHTFPVTAKATVSRPINPRDRNTLTIATKRLRLVFPRNPFGYGVFAVEVHDGKGQKLMALSPQLLLVGYLNVRRQPVIRSVFATQGRKLDKGGLTFPFSWEDIDDRTVWRGEVKFEPDGDLVKISWQLSATRTKSLVGVQSPTLFVGDNTFGKRKEAGLLPGVYWLLPDETTLDTRYTDPPHHDHHVPHPYKLTQPLMAVAYDGAFVGLMWDALQQWGEGDGRGCETGLCPQPLFASPNHVSVQDNHLLGLMVPNVPRWVKENSEWAQTPLLLEAQKEVKATAWLIGGRGGILDAYDAYFAKFPLPTVPERPYPDSETFRRSKMADRSDRYGRLRSWLCTLESHATNDARTQREDGSWAFVIDKGWTLEMLRKFAPHRPLDEYGKEGDTTLGTCTFVNRRATALLRYGRVTGSQPATELGMKAISFIDKAFVRPEGAQTWEVPLHCPDVLAAANAIHAYLEAWQITGETYWLERAIYWAKTGLPFIYLWNPPDRPTMMAYSSIPVFGTSFFTAAPWFGTPVQWNGLDYAYALLKLAKAMTNVQLSNDQLPNDRWHDARFWRQIAEGITVCGIQHQASVNHPNGNYPDSVALTYRYGPNDQGILPPHGIVRNLWLLHDFYDDAGDYETKAVSRQQPAIRVTSEAILERVECQDDSLTIVLRQPKGVWETLTLIACVTEPKEVRANDALVTRHLSLVTPSWRYDVRRKMVVVRLRHDSETTTLKLIGVEPTLYEQLGIVWETPNWEFNIDDEPDDWESANHLAPFEVRGGVLKTHSTGGDPYMHSPPIRIDAQKFRTLAFRLRVQFPPDAQPTGQVFWVRDDDPNWSESKSVHFPLPTDGQWHEGQVNLSASPEWKGIITQLRLDLGSGIGIVMELDFVRLE